MSDTNIHADRAKLFPNDSSADSSTVEDNTRFLNTE